MEGINEELLFNADFRTRLNDIQRKWADGKLSTNEYLATRKDLENEYKKELTSTVASKS